MPYTAKQNRLFQAAAHNREFAERVGISQSDARKMASEGVKADPKKLAHALKKRSKD